MNRPDIANAIREVARHGHIPSRAHWEAVPYITRYLNDARTVGIVIAKSSGLGIKVYTGLDYARNNDDARSVSGSKNNRFE